ncbi:MAG TPA: NADH-quinone oxidoreductase subunit L [Candidatus Azoamicus sp.]
MDLIKIYVLIIVFSPLFSAAVVGLSCRVISNSIAHYLTSFMVFVSLIFSLKLLYMFSFKDVTLFEDSLYIWGTVGNLKLEVGFLIDRLTCIMLFVVTCVSFLVHVYTIGYMSGDGGYNRFFSYISFFTFAMLMLVVSNNFLQLFFGWEGVGLASYLLIGFWFDRESAVFANLKAFIVNRVGDLGFLLGIAAIYCCFGSLNYLIVFDEVKNFVSNGSVFLNTFLSFTPISAITFICICLFIGAMGKSAQVPLHVWLPDSMEGPTPISALIHAATMVTAGIFMVARMSPIFEYSATALSFVMIIGAVTCFFMGLLGIVQNDIKRVVAYSTLSQLGLMVTALGVSAYSAAIFHLFTHAFFKALLFLGAGSVIVALHHEQDIRYMGNLKKYMPITYYTMLIGSLALAGIPGFAGFFSKDLIIDSVKMSSVPFAGFIYYVLVFAVFVTSFYSFRMFFLVFHTNERIHHHSNHDNHHSDHNDHQESSIKESPFVITIPLIILSIFSLISGWLFFDKILAGFFENAIFVKDNSILLHLKHELVSSNHLFLHGFISLPFLMSVLGIICAWYLYCVNSSVVLFIRNKFNFIYSVLINKYGFDDFNQYILALGTRKLGFFFWKIGDLLFIDKLIVNGIPLIIKYFSDFVRGLQSGRIYNYVYIMVTGFALLLYYVVAGDFSSFGR